MATPTLTIGQQNIRRKRRKKEKKKAIDERYDVANCYPVASVRADSLMASDDTTGSKHYTAQPDFSPRKAICRE